MNVSIYLMSVMKGIHLERKSVSGKDVAKISYFRISGYSN